MEKIPFFCSALVRIRAKIETNTLFDRALVRIRAKIEKKTLCGRTSVYRKNTLFCRALANGNNKQPLVSGFWLE